LQIVEPVGFLVGFEELEGPQVMDLKSVSRPADLALVPIAVERFLAGAVPVASSVLGPTSLPTGVVVASDVDAPPLPGTLESAKVVRQDLALIADKWLAARITLDLNGARCAAFAIAPIAAACHTPESNSKYEGSAGAPPLDYWVIPTQAFSGAHYAAFPAKLCEIPVKAMCPQKVCTTCGQPSRRITEPSAEYDAARCKGDFFGKNNNRDAGLQGERLNGRPIAEYLTVGWTDCGHNTWRTGVVLDPFAGTGTTLAVATGHGRDAIGIDIDARNADLATDRVGPLMLTVEHPERAA
jgi:hypothetical protein